MPDYKEKVTKLCELMDTYAKEDIMDPSNDGSILYEKGALVETLITGASGKVTSKKLPLGVYEVEEIEELRPKFTNIITARIEKIDNLLNSEYSFGNYTQTEKDYWLQKAKSVNTPFKWGSKNTWDKIWDSIGILFYLLFVFFQKISDLFLCRH